MSGIKKAPLSDRLRQGRKTKEDEFLCPDDYITKVGFFGCGRRSSRAGAEGGGKMSIIAERKKARAALAGAARKEEEMIFP